MIRGPEHFHETERGKYDRATMQSGTKRTVYKTVETITAMFRTGRDTAEIAELSGLPESQVYNILAKRAAP